MKTKHYKKLIATVLAFFFIFFGFTPLEATDSGARIPPVAKSLTGFGHSATGSVPTEQTKTEILDKVYSLQIPFVENDGQINADVTYYAETLGGAIFVTRTGELVYSLPAVSYQQFKGCVVKESLVGASISNMQGEDKALTRVNYFRGNDPSEWKTGVAAYNLVSLGEIYKGIELKLRAHGNNVEKLFYVKAGANSELIGVRIEGAESLRVNEQGELELETALGVVKFTKPCAYQEENGKRKYVEVAYAVDGGAYGFSLGAYDRQKELVIDPFLASTFLGGSNSDRAYCVSLDASGNVYVAGYTYSSDFPTTSGAYDTSFNYHKDAFVSKLDGNLEQLLASTFLGGSVGNDIARSISIDSSGNVYVTGKTGSLDFPITAGAYNTTYSGSGDAFVLKLDGNLQLLASTFLGGSSGDKAHSVSIDSSGNVYVAGHTGYTDSSDFPTTAGAYSTTYSGFGDAFVSKLDGNLDQLLASTFLGGSASDLAYCISISNSNVYVAGETYSSDFPTSPDAYDPTLHGFTDAFVSRLNSSLDQLLSSTFLGGTTSEWAHCISIDSSGNVYVAGYTGSSNFPTTAGAYDETYNDAGEAFVSKLGGSLDQLLASTFLGGGEYDIANSISIDSSGNVYVAGYTYSSDFPTSPGAYDETYNGAGDAFVSRLAGSLDQLSASTFLGGDGWDNPYCISRDSSDNVYVAGGTLSSGFPTSAGGFDTTYNESGDAFVSRLNLSTGPNISVFPASHDFENVDVGSPSTETFTVANTGDADLVIGSISITGADAAEFGISNDNCSGQTLASLDSCTVDVILSSTSEGSKSATLSIPSDDPDTATFGVTLAGETLVDSDGDGLTNDVEAQLGTNPNVADTDNDGMPDGWEVTYGLDPLVDDASDDFEGDGISNIDEYLAGTDPTVTQVANQPPYQPDNYLPADGSTDVSLTPTLETQDFDDPNSGDTHLKTRWQISTTDFSSPSLVFDVTSASYLTTLAVDELVLKGSTEYYWRVIFYDNHGKESAWSQAFSFTTAIDPDNQSGVVVGVPDEYEVDADEDLDEDGESDNQQTDIKSVISVDPGKKIGLKHALIKAITPIDPTEGIYNTSNKPEEMPYGLITFVLEVDNFGDDAYVEVYLSEPASTGMIWWKFDKFKGGWYDYVDYYNDESLVTFSNDRKKITLRLKDGGYGDADGVANGRIVDPSGLGSPSASAGDGSGGVAGGGGGGGGCFIATAVFGSPMERHVTMLKGFRDTYLVPYALGRTFVRTYNKYSPPLAHFIAKHKTLKVAVQISLVPVVAVSYATLHLGPAVTLTLLVVLLVTPIFLVSFYRTRARAVR